jgi:hypothetical protein
MVPVEAARTSRAARDERTPTMRAQATFGAAAMLVAVMCGPMAAQEPAQEPAGDGTSPDVAEIGFGTGWNAEELALTGEAKTFPAGTERIYCRTLITGAEEPTTVTHVWYREGKTMARVELAVGSSRWRTKSSKRLLPEWTGEWEVRVLDAAGTVLGSATFTVQ